MPKLLMLSNLNIDQVVVYQSILDKGTGSMTMDPFNRHLILGQKP